MSASESRSAIVLELAEEFLERYRQGERPSLKDYISRHPELAAEIKEVFPAMALMENVALADESLADEATGPTQVTGDAPLTQLGDYRILREVGRGGMGIVYEAEQISLGRHVALKVLPRKMFVDAQQRRRFERESKAAAKLHHTNIVPVFGVGEHEGLPYYVMQFIQGLGLDDVLDELKRMQGGTATATSGQPRAPRKDMSAADAARSLMTGAFDERGCVSAPSELGGDEAQGVLTQPRSGAHGVLTHPRSSESITDKSSGSLTLSSSALNLPGSGGAAQGKSGKATYWQSVARIGVQVADALEYAHKQGIQHRDIKPSNLLLDTRGTVWVTDFGLARADSEDHLTQTGDIVGTLRYMPPEAFEGRADKRGDIYALGLTLYELLALKPAFEEKDRRYLIKRVTTEEPPRLDKLNRTIPRDLVTIVHKAIDREASHRYATAGELTADLQRFLDDEPIRARRISSPERFARWCRHYPGVASLTAILALLLVGVTAASLLAAAHFDRMARQERQSREEAEQAKDHEATLRAQAEAAKQQVEQQKQRADANFAKARKAVDKYFTTVSDSDLLRVSGMQPLRRDLLQSALAFYQDFLKERGDDPAIRGELAAAFLRVGKIRRELGEWDASSNAYRQAQQLYEALSREAPASVEWRHGLAQCYFSLGRNDDAITLWQKLVRPGEPRFQKQLADAYNVRAVKYVNAGKLAEALPLRQQVLAIREMLVRANPDDPESQRDLGGALSNIASVLYRNGRYEEMLALCRRASDHAEIAFAGAPQVIANGTFLANCLTWIAYLERHFGREKEAMAALQRSVKVYQKLARDNPAVPSVHSGLFNAYSYLMSYQRELNQTEQARRTMNLAREVGERLPSDSPTDLYNLACYRALNATFALRPGDEKATAEERAEQKRQADQAMEALRKAIAAGYKDLNWIRQDADLHVLRGRADFKALEADLAARVVAAPQRLKASQDALALRQQLARDDPRNRRLQADLAASEHAIALIQLDLGKLDEARKHLGQAIALREALVKGEPKNAEYQTDLARSRFALGNYYWQSGRLTGEILAMRRDVAQHYARAGLWSEAAGQYDQLLLLKGATISDYFDTACLALRAGDTTTYRRICAAFVKRFGASADLSPSLMIPWASCLADKSGMEPSPFLKWRGKTEGTTTAKIAWESHVRALTHYRSSQFAEAIAQAEKSNADSPKWSSNIFNWPLLAMAHHRLGHVAESRKWLDKSLGQWRRLSPLMRSPGSLTVLPTTSEYWQKFWHDWLVFEILLREASGLMTGTPGVEDALDHCHRSLLFTLLGDNARAEVHWQAAVKLAPSEPSLWLARGRVFAQLGQHDKADAAFAKATALSPDELDRFPQAGWWVVGPYPEDLRLSCPPEKDPDPSRSVTVANGPRELSWRSVPTEPDGRVRLWEVFRASHVSVYALSYVYSPRERTAMLMVGGDDRVRVWLNGRRVHERTEILAAAWDLDLVPVTLKAGRNTLLCKVSQDVGSHYLYLRIADNPVDKALIRSRLGLWDEATALYDRGIDRDWSTELVHGECCLAHLLAGDTAGYRRCLDRMLERFDQDIATYSWLAYVGGLLDGAVPPARLVELAERGLERKIQPFAFHVAGLAHYRAEQWERAIERFEESLKDPRWQVGGGHTSELGLALAHHRLGHARQARQWLDRAELWYDKAIRDALLSPRGSATLHNWAVWPSFVILRREARKLLLGTEVPDDPRLRQLAERTRDWIKNLDPATADYDLAIRLRPGQAGLRLARGARLAELERNKQAEADLTLAVERLADDPEAWKERGRLYVQMGQTDKAVADFRKAIELLGEKAQLSDPGASEADRLFAKLFDESVLTTLTAAVQDNPEDMDRRRARGEWYARHRRWKEAAADFKFALQQDPPARSLRWLHVAPALAAAGDLEGYRWLCRELRKRFGDSQDPYTCDHLAKVHSLLPGPDKDIEWAAQLTKRATTLGKNEPWAPYMLLCKSLADYRRGKYRAASEELDGILRRIASRHEVEGMSFRILFQQDLSACCHVLLAMTLFKEGNAKAAREHFEQATKLLARYVREAALFPAYSDKTYSHDWLIVWLLHREARKLIEGNTDESKR